MNKELCTILKQAKGNVLGIGLNQEQVDILEKNDDVTVCNLLNSYSKESSGKKKREKTIYIKKLRHYFKKKSVDIIFCKYEEMEKYLNSFVKNSIYINKNTLYFFGNVDEEEIKRRYLRYEIDITFSKHKDGSIITIKTEKAKNNKIKEVFYSIVDGIRAVIIFIGDILMN